jgi:hypothetical protein
MLKAFLNVRTVRSAQLVEKGFLIGGREGDCGKLTSCKGLLAWRQEERPSAN